MSIILGIETATELCSVALGRNGIVLAEHAMEEANRHASHLHTLIREILDENGIDLRQLDAIAVSKGPGSYTGLRVGVSAAKGLCYALDIPMLAVNSLQSFANRILLHCPTDAELIVPLFDARRMEVYTAAYDRQLNMVEPTAAHVLQPDSFSELLEKKVTVFAGTGMEKWQRISGEHPNARFIPSFRCGADGLILPAEHQLKKGQTENVAYFEPLYLKDFVGTTPKNKFPG